MELIRGWYNIKPCHQKCVVTIGNFDGMHLGHQRIIARSLELARERHLPAIAIIFEPQPLEYINPDKAPIRLTHFREKWGLLKKTGLDGVLCLHFNSDLEHWSDEEFVQRILVDGLMATSVVVGEDFQFGYQRCGTIKHLAEFGHQHGFHTEALSAFDVAGERVSSTRVRQALQIGELDLVKELLGRNYVLQGRVVHGDKKGRLLGFPTANIHLHYNDAPLSGVFAVNMHGVNAKTLPGIANIGFRPTVCGKQLRLEVHLLDFSQEIYGQHVQIEFLKKIRNEQKFGSLDELKGQIAQDEVMAREYFT